MLARFAVRLAALLAVAWGAGMSHADVLHLKGGRRIEGTIVDEGPFVRVEISGGSLTVPRERVVRIERALLPADRIAAARAELVDGDHLAALTLADEAGELGLLPERGDLLRQAAAWAPDDPATAEALWRWQVFERIPDEDPDAAHRLLAACGDGAQLYRTQHWRIAHDMSLDDARERGEMLEAAWRKFHELSERLGMPREPLDGRLEVLLFSAHQDWVRATGLTPMQVAGMNGIFLGSSGRVLLFDTLTAPEAQDIGAETAGELSELARAREALSAQQAELDTLRGELDDAQPTTSKEERVRRTELATWISGSLGRIDGHRDELSRRESELQRYRTELARYFARESLASTTHEACHQLAFASGLGRPGEPRWLTEGLATIFEVTARTDFVLEAPNRGRLEDVRRLWRDDRGGNLSVLVTDGIFASTTLNAAQAYAEAWSLTHFLAMRHTEAFARFVREAPLTPPGPPGATQRLSEFRRFFGDDLEALERAWQTYVRRL